VLVLLVSAATLAITVVLGLAALLLLLGLVNLLTVVQRSRHEAFRGIAIPAELPEYEGQAWFGRRLVDLRSDRFWRQVGYHLLAGVFGAGAFLVATGWAVALLLLALPAYAWTLSAGGPFGWDLHHPPTVLVLAVCGGALMLASPWPALALAELDSRAAGSLLGRNRRRELARQLSVLGASRAAAVSAADAERRRIERDLHDGVQQRLLSLAMNLGIVRSSYPDLPEPVRLAVDNAHEEAKLVLSELRDLVRGLYPAVLTDRGLDAALSGIAARSPVPVTLRVDLPERSGEAVEAVAYYVVAESLSNAAKHSAATKAQVEARRSDGLLRISVTDDGCGGARPGAGTGLRGLAERVESVDGVFHIDSPSGGPTVITAELPCAS
jgi:signal transduction histidine kinase